MKQKCLYQKGVDIVEPCADCSPNITDSIEKGYIEDRNIPSLFNGIDSVDGIGLRARDTFDMVSYQNSVKKLRGQARKNAEKLNV